MNLFGTGFCVLIWVIMPSNTLRHLDRGLWICCFRNVLDFSLYLFIDFLLHCLKLLKGVSKMNSYCKCKGARTLMHFIVCKIYFCFNWQVMLLLFFFSFFPNAIGCYSKLNTSILRLSFMFCFKILLSVEIQVFSIDTFGQTVMQYVQGCSSLRDWYSALTVQSWELCSFLLSGK